jgi:dephospho-CoA kinase
MKTLKNKLVIGITGGMGSGKTEVCRKLADAGFKVLYSDLIAKELYHKNKNLAVEMVKEFGKGILNYKGLINLAKLREEIFKNDANNKKINKVVHPVVIDYIKRQISRSKEKMIIVESAVLFESGLDKEMSYIILVYANKKNRIQRIMERDGATKADVERIMRYQDDDKTKIEKCDFVLVNNKDVEHLNEQADFLVKVLNALK